MRHLVVCCDGTWNTPEQEQGGVPTPTNVVRLHHALGEDKNQLRYYHPGVGTGPGLVDRLRGGGLAHGPTAPLPEDHWAEIDRLYDEVYRPVRERSAGPAPYPPVPIRFLGVWDTVGSLGIPDSLGVLKLFDRGAARWRAQHAAGVVPRRPLRCGGRSSAGRAVRRRVAVDDRPGEGVHRSDFREGMLEQVHPDPGDVLHNSCTGVYLHLGPTPRAVPLIDKQRCTDVVHTSVFDRQHNAPITIGEYRPGRVLKIGESASYVVYAGQTWNAMGLHLDTGRYSFQAAGEWLDRGVPGGTRDGRFHPSEVFQLMGSVAGWMQERFRQVSGNEAAAFFGAPRVHEAPWMALIGVVKLA